MIIIPMSGWRMELSRRKKNFRIFHRKCARIGTKSMLQMTGYFFVSSMKQRNLVRKLQEISFHDQLTKLGNRFALEDYATQVDSRRSIGVVFCDITGLKRVNDSQGHIAGDKFIMDASECLKNAFGDQNNGLFRIGGDELLVLCPEMTKKCSKKR